MDSSRVRGVRRRRTGSIAVVAIAVLVLTACQPWTNRRFDATNNPVNPAAEGFTVDRAPTIQHRWTAPSHTGALTDGVWWYATGPTGDLEVLALDGSSCAAGTCTPSWRAEGTPVALAGTMVITVAAEAGGVRVHAVDRGDADACAGVPRTCPPAWRSPLLAAPVSGTDVSDTARATGSRLAVLTADGLAVWSDLRSPARCGEVEVGVCPPDWQSSHPGAGAPMGFAVAGRDVLVSFADVDFPPTAHLAAFDLDGVDGCSGVPATCTPRWRTESVLNVDQTRLNPVVAGARVYATTNGYAINEPSIIHGWSLVDCPGAPTPCAATWSAVMPSPTPSQLYGTYYTIGDPLVVGDDVVVQRSTSPILLPSTPTNRIVAFSSRGTSGLRTWRAEGHRPNGVVGAGGLVFTSTADGVGAVDAAGRAGCTGYPRECPLLWSSTEADEIVAVAGTHVLGRVDSGGTAVFSL